MVQSTPASQPQYYKQTKMAFMCLTDSFSYAIFSFYVAFEKKFYLVEAHIALGKKKTF